MGTRQYVGNNISCARQEQSPPGGIGPLPFRIPVWLLRCWPHIPIIMGWQLWLRIPIWTWSWLWTFFCLWPVPWLRHLCPWIWRTWIWRTWIRRPWIRRWLWLWLSWPLPNPRLWLPTRSAPWVPRIRIRISPHPQPFVPQLLNFDCIRPQEPSTVLWVWHTVSYCAPTPTFTTSLPEQFPTRLTEQCAGVRAKNFTG